MWIAILKLVIYSVLEMRMMIGIYRARSDFFLLWSNVDNRYCPIEICRMQH